jgi:phosphatidylglycerol:prolipoprotein diacylglycerol transferase
MHPIFFKLGPITIHTYGVFIALAFLLALITAQRQAARVGINKEIIVDVGFYAILSAIVGSRLLFILYEYDYYIAHPLDIFKIWQGGLVFYGGLFAAVTVTIIYLRMKKIQVLKVADIFAPSIALGQGIGRLGCFSAGCCFGKPTTIPWGVTFTNKLSLIPEHLLGVKLHPTQLYESFGAFIIFIFLFFFQKRQTFKGQILFLYSMLYGILRFITEFFRAKETQEIILEKFSFSQTVSVVIFIGSVIMLFYLYKKSPSSG